MSLKELKREMETYEKAIAERKNRLLRLDDAESTPEKFLEKTKLEMEIRFLEQRLSELKVEHDRRRKELESIYPSLQKRYQLAVEEQWNILRQINAKIEELDDLLQKLQRSVDRIISEEGPQYTNVCNDLDIPSHTRHLLGLPHCLIMIKRGGEQFKTWWRDHEKS
ncbi:MAG: hypothetical protein QXT58_02470 [Archaeoglobaceae archaeon]